DGTISGHVYGTDGVTPLEDIAVEAYHYVGSQSVYLGGDYTDAAGAYQIEGLGTESYLVRASGLGYNAEYYQNSVGREVAAQVGVTTGSDTPNIDFTLDLFGTTGTINGSVTLVSRPPKPHPRWSIPMWVRITPQGGGAPVFNQMVMTDPYGLFLAPGILPGSYRIWGKGTRSLANAVNVTVVLGNSPIDLGELIEGDANDNNVVTITDFSILAASFTRSTGQIGFDARSDFNGDGTVNILDFSLLAASFGQSGAAP
ncbi:MAG: carboxypeptidase regulatory-like domain-containing protein, partial [Anaerolineae bacterium]|nr:carboxypeptidase regulatory-like domain-containing protein [Anaerolineae bacterium]